MMVGGAGRILHLEPLIVAANLRRPGGGVRRMATMKIATFNVNGIKTRLAHLLQWLGREQPDVACLQELKALDGMSVDGRSITVNLARPREEGRSQGGYGADGFKATKRADVGYGNGGYGGGRY